MRNRDSSWWIWFIMLIIIFNSGLFFPLLAIVGVVLAITFASIQASKKGDVRNRGYQKTTHYYRSSSNTRTYSSATVAKINVYLRRYFRNHRSVPVGTSIELRLHGERYASLASLDVYRDGTYICSMNEFQRRYPDSYDEIIKELTTLAASAQEQNDVIDAEAAPTPEKKPEESRKQSASVEFMNEINELNANIPDEEITNGLYETSALLKQIQNLEEKFPNSKDKLKKLYEYYLPILTRILKQYETLQNVKTDDAYEETRNKLNRTITLINDAMKKIISSMTDQDFINLSADISTLEAVLQKDGLTSEGQMQARKLGE